MAPSRSVQKDITLLEQKNGTKSTLPLNGKVLEVLKSRAKLKQTGYMFANRVGKPLGARNLPRVFFQARDKAGLANFRWHDLRHTWASRLVQGGCDVYTVQRLGRWKTISMVMRYAHHDVQSLRKGIEIMDAERPSDSAEIRQNGRKGL